MQQLVFATTSSEKNPFPQVDDEEVDPAAEFLSREQEQLGDIDKELEAALTGTHLSTNPMWTLI